MRAGYPVVEIAIAAGIFLAANGVYGLELMIGRNLPAGEDIATLSENPVIDPRDGTENGRSLCIASSLGQHCIPSGKVVTDIIDEESSLHEEASSDTITLFVLPE